MASIYLTSREKRFLFSLRFRQHAKPRFDVSVLASYGLIHRNYLSEKNEIGEYVPDGTYSLSDLGKRWFIQQREERFVKKLPVVLSVIALIKSFWPEIMSAFQWIIETVRSISN